MSVASKARAAPYAANVLLIIREVQAGASLNAIAAQLNARKVATANGGLRDELARSSESTTHKFRGRISSEGRFSSSDNLRMLAAMRRASSLIRSLAAGRPLWHFATNNDTTTLAVVADALVSSLRVAAVSPPSVAVWARRCLTRAIHGHPPPTFHSGIGLRSFSPHLMDLHCSKAGDQRGDRPNGVVAIVDIA